MTLTYNELLQLKHEHNLNSLNKSYLEEELQNTCVQIYENGITELKPKMQAIRIILKNL